MTEVVSLSLVAGMLLIEVYEIASIYHTALIENETEEEEFFIALLASVVGVYGFFMGLVLLTQNDLSKPLDVPAIVVYAVWKFVLFVKSSEKVPTN